MSKTIDELQLAIEHLSNAVEELKQIEVEGATPCTTADIDAEPAPLNLHRNSAGVYVPEETDADSNEFNITSKMTKQQIADMFEKLKEQMTERTNKADQLVRENDMLFEKAALAAQEVIKLNNKNAELADENDALKEKMKSMVPISDYDRVNTQLLKLSKQLSIAKINNSARNLDVKHVIVNKSDLLEISLSLLECLRMPEGLKDREIDKARHELNALVDGKRVRSHHRVND